jgi:peptide/nickel transport system permease protein
MFRPLDLLLDLLGRLRPTFSPRVSRNLKKQFRNSLLAKIGVVLVIGIVLVAVFAPVIAPHNPKAQNLNETQLPPLGFTKTVNETSAQVVDGELRTITNETTINAKPSHPLGTDGIGRDMLSRVIYGARTSLMVGVLGTILAVVVGVPVGLVAGYSSGTIDDALMRVADVSLAFPSLVLAIALSGCGARRRSRSRTPS